MLILRATAKLLARAKPDLDKNPPASTGLLGDWYANLLYVDRQQLILAVSAKTLLPVVIPAKEIRTLPTRLPTALGEVLAGLQVPSAVIETELRHMAEHRYAKTASRTVLGVMNDYLRMLPSYADPGRPLLDVALHLAEAPMRPLKMESPDHETQKLFGCATRRTHGWVAAAAAAEEAAARPSGPPPKPRFLPFLSSISGDLPSKGSPDVDLAPSRVGALSPKPTREDRARVAQKLLEAESTYYQALRRHRDEHSDESRIALAGAERALRALEDWAAQVSREEVFH